MKLFIGCSSSNDLNYIYYDKCTLFLEEILKDNDLVYGAYNNGIMAIAYDIAHKYKRDIIAITTDKYKEELKSLECIYKESTPNIFRRSEELIKKADMIIILPGGIGTITELISAVETMRNNEFHKPILIYNINGFFNKFLEFMDKVYEEKFSNIEDSKYYFIANNKEDALKYIDSCKEK